MNSSRAVQATTAPSQAQPVTVELPPFALKQILPWLALAALILFAAMYFVSAEQGATSLLAGTAVHEWTHDGRHLLGFPCH